MSALARQKYTLSDGSFRDTKIYTVPWNLFFNKRSGAVVISPDSEELGAAVVAGVGSILTQPGGISYSPYTVNPRYNDSIVPDVAIKMNLLL